MAVALLGLVGFGAIALYEHRGASLAAHLAEGTNLPGDVVLCSQVPWARGGEGTRCATSTKDAETVAEEFVADLHAAGVDRIRSSCLDVGIRSASCVVETPTSFSHSMILIIQTRSDERGRLLGVAMEVTTRTS